MPVLLAPTDDQIKAGLASVNNPYPVVEAIQLRMTRTCESMTLLFLGVVRLAHIDGDGSWTMTHIGFSHQERWGYHLEDWKEYGKLRQVKEIAKARKQCEVGTQNIIQRALELKHDMEKEGVWD